MTEADRAFEARQCEILNRLQARVVAAIDDACNASADNMSSSSRGEPPLPRGYFASLVMQLGYRVQCGADDEKFQGGDAKMAWHAIQNAVDISNHYWGSNFELRVK